MRAVRSALLIVGFALGSNATPALSSSPPGASQALQPQLAQAARPPLPPGSSQALQPQPRPSLAQAAQSSQLAESAQASQPSPPTLPVNSSDSTQPQSARYSADGLYNMANSYARAGKPGLAVLNYERATLLAPNDPDIAANLEYVRTSAHVSAEAHSRFAQMARAIGPTQAAWLGIVGILLFGAALVSRKKLPRLRWLRAGTLALGIVLVTLTLSNAMLLWPHLHEAVVLTNQTPALVSPVPMADTAFVLPEAETVTMTARHEDYILVRTHGGLSGWVARGSLGAVVP